MIYFNFSAKQNIIHIIKLVPVCCLWVLNSFIFAQLKVLIWFIKLGARSIIHTCTYALLEYYKDKKNYVVLSILSPYVFNILRFYNYNMYSDTCVCIGTVVLVPCTVKFWRNFCAVSRAPRNTGETFLLVQCFTCQHSNMSVIMPYC